MSPASPSRSASGYRKGWVSSAAANILIAAGPTREKIDPVRYMSNYSTGTFGYELAADALRRGAHVTLVSGPTDLETPPGVRLIRVESAIEMRKAMLTQLKWADYVIMSAAVSDWRPGRSFHRKIKRSSEKLCLELVENPDILREICAKKGNRVVVGFALETEDLERNALKKLLNKEADIIVANSLSRRSPLFGGIKADILLIDRLGNKVEIRNKSKRELAKIILDKMLNFNI